MAELGWLALASVVFLGAHTALSSTPLRGALVARIGAGPYLGLFSLLNLAALVTMVMAFRAAPRQPLWPVAPALDYVPLVVMPFALPLLVAGFWGENPTGLGRGGAAPALRPARGIQRVTRHPGLMAILAWALAHLCTRSDAASLIFFGTLALLAAVGPRLIDRKRRNRLGAAWEKFEAETSVLPFGAILGGRNQLHMGELGWAPPAVGLVLYALLLWGHTWLFGFPALPL